MLKTTISYLKQRAVWFWRSAVHLLQGRRLFYGPLIAIGLPLFSAWLLPPTEFSFRLVGFVLQVLGVGTVWIGIRGIRKRHNMGSFAQWKAWLASFPRFHGRTFALSGKAVASVSASGELDIWSRTPEGASLEQRVNTIEKNLRRVHEDLSAHRRKADARVRLQKEEMKRERAEREAADKEIHDKIKETETDSLELNTAGVLWLFVGTICSTFPEEIARVAGAW